MRYFPLFYDLQNVRVVVVGGGEEALRKVRLFLKTPAQIEVIAETLHPELAGNSRVYWRAKAYEATYLQGAALAVCADVSLNRLVSADAKALGIPFNAVDDAALSSFIVPAIVDRDPVVVAIGTEGAAPILAQNIRAKVDALLPVNLGSIAQRAAALRGLVAKKLAHGFPRRAFWADFFFGSVAEAEKSNDKVAYELALGDALFNHSQAKQRHFSTIIVPLELDLLTLREHRALMEADYIVHTTDVPAAVLEMARRDAVRLLPHQIDQLDGVSGNIVYISVSNSEKVPSANRRDLKNVILKAAL